jgi:hypothetical protein
MERKDLMDLKEGDLVISDLRTTATYVGFCWGKNSRDIREGEGRNYIATRNADIIFCSTDPRGHTSAESQMFHSTFTGLNINQCTLGDDKIMGYEILRRKVR